MPVPTPQTPTRRAPQSDALGVLRAAHQVLDKLFFAFHLLCERDDTAEGKRALIERMYVELMTHLQLVSEVVHPALQQAGLQTNAELIDEARHGQRSAREMLAAIVSSPLEDATRDARVEALGEFMHRQFGHEQGLLIPALRQSGVALDELGRVLMKRRQALLAVYGRALSHGDPVEDEAADPVGRPVEKD